MHSQYYKKKKNIKNSKNIKDEKKIIDYIFENKSNIYNIDAYLINEAGFFDTVKNAATNPQQFYKNTGKDMAKSVLNFAMFNSMCGNLAANLNKTWAIKAQAYAIIKDIYPKAMQVLNFFYRSKYALIIWRGFKKYYTWDLAMATILLYEGYKDDKGIMYAISQSKKTTPADFRTKINEYHGKIKSGALTINRLTKDVEDSEGGESGLGGMSDREKERKIDETSELGKIIKIVDDTIRGSGDFSDFKRKLLVELTKIITTITDIKIKKNVSTLIDFTKRGTMDKYSSYIGLNKRKVDKIINDNQSIFEFPIEDVSGNEIIKRGSTIGIPPEFDFGNIAETIPHIKMFFLFSTIALSDNEYNAFINAIIVEID